MLEINMYEYDEPYLLLRTNDVKEKKKNSNLKICRQKKREYPLP